MTASDSSPDTAVVAFRRLLAETSGDTQARVDALMALNFRQVWVATWPGHDEPRTVTNSARETALPVFTGMDTLEAAAGRLGFRGPDGGVAARQVSARDALRHALARSVHFLVIDAGAPHAMEFARGEIEPLLNAPTQRGVSGPYAASRDAEDSLWNAVRSSSRPPAAGRGSFYPKELSASDVMEAEPSTGVRRSEIPPADEGDSPLQRSDDASRIQAELASAGAEEDDTLDDLHTRPTLVGGPSPEDTVPFDTVAASERELERSERTTTPSIPAAHLRAAARGEPQPIEDALLDELSQAMRPYPEIEWASVWWDKEDGNCIGIRVDPAFLNRLTEISDKVTEAAAAQQVDVSVIILHTHEEVQHARQRGTVIFPGRRRAVTR